MKKAVLILFLFGMTFKLQAQSNIVGRVYDPQANGYLNLWSSSCPTTSLAGAFPFYWNATGQNGNVLVTPNGQPFAGCYSLNPQSQQVAFTTETNNGQPALFPYSAVGVQSNGGQQNGNSFLNFVSAVTKGLQGAANYWNNSANETQRNMTNLTPGIGGGRAISCTPDGRGGYNCR